MSDKPRSSDSHSPEDDAPGTPGSGASDSSSSAADPSSSSASASSGSTDVPPEKAPDEPPAAKQAAESKETNGDSPAAGLKGLQKGEAEERRGLLAQSRALRSLLTSNRPLGVRNLLWATLAVLVVIAGLLAATGRFGTVTQSIADSFRPDPGDARPERTLEEVADESDDGTFSFAELSAHPDNALEPYFAGTIAGSGEGQSRADLVRQFRQMADLFEKRMGEDDNFTMRVIDGRTDSLLEVATLEAERQKYLEAGEPDDYNWGRINQLRRQKTRQLVDKWVARGIPQEPIRIKWGRANETRNARTRDNPFIEYEIRLARFMGKSLLMTEIGTVETFNHDTWVSSVDAKSRYQLMPSLLSEYGLNRYRLSTTAGNNVLVAEEQHPLLSMEPAFMHAAASINAMGHEIPGVSAYHTGVNNIYTEILVKFLKNGGEYISPGVTTADAYIWGITEGFDIVTRNSSFGNFSREYVVSAYGALKAMEEATIDTSQTMLADRVKLNGGQSIPLNELLTTLAENGGGDLPWNTPDSLSLYQRFDRMNRHFHLPSGPSATSDTAATVAVGVPERGNVQLAATAQGDTVRFFLPPGARGILKSNGYANLIDESSVFAFNHNTYPDPSEGLRLEADRKYAALIDEIRRFGFTSENRQQLKQLAQTFDQLAASEPSHYRRVMRDVIAKHRQFWRYPGWDNVVETAQAVLGRTPAQPQQPQQLPSQPLQTPENVDANAEAGR